MRELTYLIYIVIFEAMTLGGTWYAVFVLDHSGWWFLLGVFLSAAAYRPETWIHGISRRKLYERKKSKES